MVSPLTADTPDPLAATLAEAKRIADGLPTPLSVSAVLSAAGFDPSLERGEGYRVQGCDPPAVRVFHVTALSRGLHGIRIRARMLHLYAKTLRDEGWTVRRPQAAVTCLLVTGAKGGDDA